MKDISFKRTHGKYTYIYKDGVFKVFTDLTPEFPITEVKTDKIKKPKRISKKKLCGKSLH